MSNQGPDHYSFSQLRTAAMCMRKWYFEKIEKLPMKPIYIMASGQSFHKALETHNLERLAGGPGLEVKDVVEVAVTELEQIQENRGQLLCNKGLPFDKAEAKDKLVVDCFGPAKSYLQDTEQLLGEMEVPAEEPVEKELNFEMAGKRFIGYVDLVLKDSFIDYKLAARRKSANQVKHDPQLRLYSHVLKKPGGFIECIRGKEIAEWTPQPVAPGIDEGVLQWVHDAVLQLEAAKKSGLFPPCLPGSWQCSRTSCPFYRKCYPYK